MVHTKHKTCVTYNTSIIYAVDALIQIPLFFFTSHCSMIPLSRYKRAMYHRDNLSSLHFSPLLLREMHVNCALSYAAKSPAVNFPIGKARLSSAGNRYRYVNIDRVSIMK